MVEKIRNRTEAGRFLVKTVSGLTGREDVVVLGLPARRRAGRLSK